MGSIDHTKISHVKFSLLGAFLWVFIMDTKPIKSEAEHSQALARLELLMDAQPGTLEGEELDILAALVDTYERQYHAIEPPHAAEAASFRLEQSLGT